MRPLSRRRVPPQRSAVFFGDSPYLLRIDETGEAGHERPVGAKKSYDRRIAEGVQNIARRQA